MMTISAPMRLRGMLPSGSRRSRQRATTAGLAPASDGVRSESASDARRGSAFRDDCRTDGNFARFDFTNKWDGLTPCKGEKRPRTFVLF